MPEKARELNCRMIPRNDSQNHTAPQACRVAATFAIIRKVGNHVNTTWTVKFKSTPLELWSRHQETVANVSTASACKVSDWVLGQYRLCPYLPAAKSKARSSPPPQPHLHFPNLKVWSGAFSVWSVSHLHFELPINLGNMSFSFPASVVLKNSLENRQNEYSVPDLPSLPHPWDWNKTFKIMGVYLYANYIF